MSIIVGDLHIREKQIYWNAQKSFLEWLLENYKHEIIIFLGDLFDSSSIKHDIVFEVSRILRKFKQVFILSGNHDQSRRMQNILLSLNHFDNIIVFFKEEKFSVEGLNCLFLPYQYDMSHYNDLQYIGDYAFGHFMIKEESFGGEFVSVEGLNVKKVIMGHIHLRRDYDKVFIPGVPVITRSGESNNSIWELTDKGLTEIKTPIFFDIKDIEFGEEVTDGRFLYNIKNVPSLKVLYEKYPDINIREEGVTLRSVESESENIDFSFKGDNLKQPFLEFCAEKVVTDNIRNTVLSYMN